MKTELKIPSGVSPENGCSEYHAPQFKVVNVEIHPVVCLSGGNGEGNLTGGEDGGDC